MTVKRAPIELIDDNPFQPRIPLGTKEPEPAEKAEICRVCGCTNDRACVTPDGPCYWVEPDLCSACAARPPISSRPDFPWR